MEQVLFGGYRNVLHNTTIEYNSLVGGYLWSDQEFWALDLVSTDGVIKHLRVVLGGAPGARNHYTFTLMLNGNPTALTFDISDLETSGSNMVNEIVVTGGDTISLQCDPYSRPVAQHATWTCVFEGDTEKESLIVGGGGYGLSKTDIEYGQVMSSEDDYSTNENDFRQVVPTSGTIKNFYVKLDIDPGTPPDAYRLTVRKNGISQALTVTITADDKTGNDLVNSFAVVAGDILTMMIEPLNTPSAALTAQWGMTFVADIDGESIVLGGSSNNLHATDTEFNYLTGNEHNTWISSIVSRRQLGQACTLKKLHVLLSGSPGAGNKYDFTLSIASADSNVVATISDAATTGNSGALEDTVADDDYVILKVVPTSNPTARDAYWGFVCYIGPEILPYSSQVRLIGTVIPLYNAQVRNIGSVYRSFSTQVRNIGNVVFPYSSWARLIGTVILPFTARVRNIGTVVFPYSSQARLIGTISLPYSSQVRLVGSIYRSYSSSVRNVGIILLVALAKCHAELSARRRRPIF